MGKEVVFKSTFNEKNIYGNLSSFSTCYITGSEYISEQGYAIYMFCNTFIEYALSGKKERNK